MSWRRKPPLAVRPTSASLRLLPLQASGSRNHTRVNRTPLIAISLFDRLPENPHAQSDAEAVARPHWSVWSTHAKRRAPQHRRALASGLSLGCQIRPFSLIALAVPLQMEALAAACASRRGGDCARRRTGRRWSSGLSRGCQSQVHPMVARAGGRRACSGARVLLSRVTPAPRAEGLRSLRRWPCLRAGDF